MTYSQYFTIKYCRITGYLKSETNAGMEEVDPWSLSGPLRRGWSANRQATRRRRRSRTLPLLTRPATVHVGSDPPPTHAPTHARTVRSRFLSVSVLGGFTFRFHMTQHLEDHGRSASWRREFRRVPWKPSSPAQVWLVWLGKV